MSTNILQINFKLNVSAQEYERAVTPLADLFNGVTGLQWKIWLLNPAESEAGGIYLFDDTASVDAFLAGPLVAQVKQAPFLRDLSVKRFDVMPTVTAITKGPVGARVPA
ncbi:MAG: YdhR family protein [Acidobacteria bacterium]|nr:YdhR family protein [Acidobacteriota bacterium]